RTKPAPPRRARHGGRVAGPFAGSPGARLSEAWRVAKLSQPRKAGGTPPDDALSFGSRSARASGLGLGHAVPFRHWAERIASIVAKWRCQGGGSLRTRPRHAGASPSASVRSSHGG